ncbi:MAG: glycosyltransferase [Chlorobiaceae bacterium]|nr:glycosyltransferase [Chlorobiaceae bacterium]
MDPSISIVTPSFNQGKFIEANIQSVLRQNIPNVEHIIIDGGSTDQTIEILKRYTHLKWISEKDSGQTEALNKGFRMATGNIIGWLNSDDTYCPSVFQLVAEYFKNPEVNVLCGDGFEIDEVGKITHPLSSANSNPETLIRYWKWKYEFVQPAFFFRRNVFEEIGYLDEKLYYAMDYDFFIRLGLRYPFKYISEPLANLRMYPESKSGRNANKLIPGYIREMQKVSMRYWGNVRCLKYYSYLGSFVGALFFSVLKNVFFTRTSKSRASVKKFIKVSDGN